MNLHPWSNLGGFATTNTVSNIKGLKTKLNVNALRQLQVKHSKSGIDDNQLLNNYGIIGILGMSVSIA